MSERVPPIRSELLAAKIKKLLNFELPELFDEFSEEPRFIDALWVLQNVSQPDNYPGGLTKFTEDFLRSCGDQLGTAEMIAADAEETHYNVAEAIAVFNGLSGEHGVAIFGDDLWIFENAFAHDAGIKSGRVTFEQVIEGWGHGMEDELQTWTGTMSELRQLLIEKLTPAIAREQCMADARESLARYFKELCELPHVGLRHNENHFGAPRYFIAVGPALLKFIAQRADAARSAVADTEVTRLVLRWMKKARSMGKPVMFSGNSRFGKTEGVKLCCEMNPGQFRLVNTPASNATGDLLREVARSLGVEVAAQNNLRELRERIDYVLRFSRIVLCFDEWQFALPSSYSRNTAPARLNWVRRAIVDRDLAAVFVCTPQSYLPAKKRFVNTTGFAMEQFDERLIKTVHLPNELSESDLLAVARIHFQDLPDDYLSLVVEAALATERNYVSDISKIATLAKDNAREEGRERPRLTDIEAAIADVLPSHPPSPGAPQTPQKPVLARSSHSACKPFSRPAQPTRLSLGEITESHSREMQPLTVKT